MKQYYRLCASKKKAFALLLGAFAAVSLFQNQTVYSQEFNMKRPVAQKGDQKDVYFGVSIADPYRWMETEKTPEILKWIDEENALTQSVLSQIPLRDELRKEMTECYDYEKQGAPSKHGSRYFYFKNSGLQNQSVLYYKTSLDGEERLFLDPNTLSDDGTVALSDVSFSKDGRYAAFAISTSGSDWRDIFVMDVETR